MEAGSASIAWPAAIRGAAAGTIPSRPKVGGASVPRLSRRKGRSHIQIAVFVNSLAANFYGSTSMDCHYPLRHRVHWLASLQRPARTAAASASCGNARRVTRRGIDRNSPISFGYSGSGRERDAIAG